ncbi:hypothetical protein AMTRI_Chr08g204730 [Amborella trichopoda]
MSSDNAERNYQWTTPQEESLLEIIAEYARKEAWALVIHHMCQQYGPGRMVTATWPIWEEYDGWVLKYQSKSFLPMNNMDLEETGEDELGEEEASASTGQNARSVFSSKRKRNEVAISVGHELAAFVGSLSSSMDRMLGHSVLFQIRCMEVVAYVYKDECIDPLFYIKVVDLFAYPMKARIFLSIDPQYHKLWLRTHVPQD